MARQAQAKVVLASVFVEIANSADQLDSVANRLLTALKQAQATTIELYEAAVTAAYTANNWQYGGGRPNAESEQMPVPPMVRTYVSEVRAAFRLGLDVLTYTSIADLRNDIRATRREAIAESAERTRRPELVGITIKTDNKLNGALFHDLIVVYEALDEAQQDAMEQALERALKKFLKPISGQLQHVQRTPPAASAGAPEPPKQPSGEARTPQRPH